MRRKVASATVCLLGLGGPGSLVAAGLATCGLEHLRLVDGALVSGSDGYFDPIYLQADRSCSRARTLQRIMESRWPHLRLEVDEQALESEVGILNAIAGSDLVVCCADRAEASLLYRLNRASMKTKIPWISCAVSGFEVVIGPTVRPYDTPCYLCYTMRSVACADDPEDDFAFRQFLDNRKQDDSGRRENLVFAAGLAANLIGLESLKLLTGIGPCATVGSVAVVNLVDFSLKTHVVLRHPRCPVCFGTSESETASSAESARTGAGV